MPGSAWFAINNLDGKSMITWVDLGLTFAVTLGIFYEGAVIARWLRGERPLFKIIADDFRHLMSLRLW